MRYTNSHVGLDIIVDRFPNRKKPCLLIGNGLVTQVVGTFTSEESAEAFCDVFKRFLEIPDEMGEQNDN